MTGFDKLKQEIKELYSLAMVQRALRLALRAMWLGVAGILTGWAINSLWGLLPNPLLWFFVGFLFAVPALVGILVSVSSFTPEKSWVWKLDQQLELHEQLSTAWEVAQDPPGGVVSELLMDDALAQVPQARETVQKEGGFRKTDLLASGVMLLLAFLLLASMLTSPAPIETSRGPGGADEQILPPEAPVQPAGTPVAPPEQLPPAGQPSQEQNGAPGAEGQMEEGSDGGESSPAGEQPGPGSQGSSAPAANPSVADALRGLGEQLSRQAGTYDLGQALKNQDFADAAEALEDLQEQPDGSSGLDDLSPESRENLEQALRDAAEAVEQAGDPQLAQEMREAADQAAQAGEAENDALGELAESMRDMGNQPPAAAAGAGTDAGTGGGSNSGGLEPLERLQGESGDFSLPVEDLSDPGLLSPAPPGTAGEGTVSGSLDSTGLLSEDTYQSPLLPNTFQWKWRELIGQYFSR